MPIRISLVEDQQPARKHFLALLESHADLSVCSVHKNAEDALLSLPIAEIDLALVDIVLPQMSGIELARALKERRSDLLVLMLTAYEDSEKIFQSLASGADGYLLKSEPPEMLRAKIDEAVREGSTLSPTIARKVIQHFRKQAEPSQELEQLTARELAVLREVAKGLTYKEVGTALGIGAETVRAHIRNIKGKLQVGTRGQAVAKFLRPPL